MPTVVANLKIMQFYENQKSIFICHASEDKKGFVKPLAISLIKHGIKVWYDEFSLQIGDSLKESIEIGIKNSDFGLVILSKNFFKKKWTKKELNALISKEIIKDKIVILPIWLDVDINDVYEFSPLLVDKLAIEYNNDLENIVSEIIEKLYSTDVIPIDVMDEILNNLLTNHKDEVNFGITAANYRLDKYFLCMNELNELYYNNKEIDEIDDDKLDDKINEMYNKFHLKIRLKYNLPNGIHEQYESRIYKYELTNIKKKIRLLFLGKMTREQVWDFIIELDDYMDADMTYILSGIPNYIVPNRTKLENAIADIGSRNKLATNK